MTIPTNFSAYIYARGSILNDKRYPEQQSMDSLPMMMNGTFSCSKKIMENRVSDVAEDSLPMMNGPLPYPRKRVVNRLPDVVEAPVGALNNRLEDSEESTMSLDVSIVNSISDAVEALLEGLKKK